MKRIALLALFVLMTVFSTYCQTSSFDGDNCFENGNYTCAELKYKEAIKLASGRDKQIAEIKLSQAKWCGEHLKKADQAFASKDYKAAKENYKSVLDNNPKDAYAKAQVEKCDNILNSINVTLSVSRENLSFSSYGGTEKVLLHTNAGEYSANNLPAWCSVEKHTDYFNVVCDANKGYVARSGYFTVTAGDKTVRINLSQSGSEKRQEVNEGTKNVVNSGSSNSSSNASSQATNAIKYIKGTVLDTKGDPMPGASISIKGTTIGTISDMDGRFNLRFTDGFVVVSFVGYERQTIPILSTTNLDNLVVRLIEKKNARFLFDVGGGVELSEYSIPSYEAILRLGFGKFKLYGKYVNNFKEIDAVSISNADGYIGNILPFYSGNVSCLRNSISGGIDFTFPYNFYGRSFFHQLLPYSIFLGVGNETNKIYWETTDGKWIFNEGISQSRDIYEGGFSFRFFKYIYFNPVIKVDNEFDNYTFMVESGIMFNF